MMTAVLFKGIWILGGFVVVLVFGVFLSAGD